jgi:hypothetical protein
MTRLYVSADIRLGSLRAKETVVFETPARSAISLIVGLIEILEE